MPIAINPIFKKLLRRDDINAIRSPWPEMPLNYILEKLLDVS